MIPVDAADELVINMEAAYPAMPQLPPGIVSRDKVPRNAQQSTGETTDSARHAEAVQDTKLPNTSAPIAPGRPLHLQESKARSDKGRAASPPAPIVPVAARPPTRPLPAERTDSGTFAAAASAARRQMSARDQYASSSRRQVDTDSGTSASRGRELHKRTSLASLRDFVAAEIPDETAAAQSEEPPVQEEEASTVKIDRLVLGPMDLSSPNRKGSEVVMQAKLESFQLSLEWQPESKVIVSVAFDAIRSLQVGSCFICHGTVLRLLLTC